ncbi:rna recognition motif-containing protein [Cystoisospora suis]|uniref:Rna recognition motif-containing protein n=1 Tax=Cystoisospora suis TaxID=483139 RepID=A0A2C6KL06_9APIC|nr:rna recognition motif-containing protein [Cystoisospora suis]
MVNQTQGGERYQDLTTPNPQSLHLFKPDGTLARPALEPLSPSDQMKVRQSLLERLSLELHLCHVSHLSKDSSDAFYENLPSLDPLKKPSSSFQKVEKSSSSSSSSATKVEPRLPSSLPPLLPLPPVPPLRQVISSSSSVTSNKPRGISSEGLPLPSTSSLHPKQDRSSSTPSLSGVPSAVAPKQETRSAASQTISSSSPTPTIEKSSSSEENLASEEKSQEAEGVGLSTATRTGGCISSQGLVVYEGDRSRYVEGDQGGLRGTTVDLKRPRESIPSSPQGQPPSNVDAVASDNSGRRTCGEGNLLPLQSGPLQTTPLHERLSIHQQTPIDEGVGGQNKKARLLSPVSPEGPEVSMMPQFSPITPIIENQSGFEGTAGVSRKQEPHAGGGVYTPQASLDGISMSSHMVGLKSSPAPLVKRETSQQPSPNMIRATEEGGSSSSSSLLPLSSSERTPGDPMLTGGSEMLREDFAPPLLSHPLQGSSHALPNRESDLLPDSSSGRALPLQGHLMPQGMGGRSSPRARISTSFSSSISLVKRHSPQDNEEGMATSERTEETGDPATSGSLPSLQPSPFQQAFNPSEMSLPEATQEESSPAGPFPSSMVPQEAIQENTSLQTSLQVSSVSQTYIDSSVEEASASSSSLYVSSDNERHAPIAPERSERDAGGFVHHENISSTSSTVSSPPYTSTGGSGRPVSNVSTSRTSEGNERPAGRGGDPLERVLAEEATVQEASPALVDEVIRVPAMLHNILTAKAECILQWNSEQRQQVLSIRKALRQRGFVVLDQ